MLVGRGVAVATGKGRVAVGRLCGEAVTEAGGVARGFGKGISVEDVAWGLGNTGTGVVVGTGDSSTAVTEAKRLDRFVGSTWLSTSISPMISRPTGAT